MQARRRTRILCTVGPACADEAMLDAMLEAGMDVARLNFSHGSHADHEHNITTLRRISERSGRTLAILQDLQGPKIRIEGLVDSGIELEVGMSLDLTGTGSGASAQTGTPLLTVSYPAFHEDVTAGMEVLLDDGHMTLRVVRVDADRARCEVVHGGLLKPRKGVNLPGAVLTVPTLTEKDIADLEFGISAGVDFVALSFVQRAEDVAEVKRRIKAAGADIPVIAKIEKPQAVAGIEAILEVADGIMIARGDLGVELPPEEVPRIQKNLIQHAVRRGIPVITATQMLESMVASPRPTRAEASDVANAVLDGTDAVMLSGETASGAYPLEAVRMMSRIVTLTEGDLAPRWDLLRRDREAAYPGDLAVGYSACHAAEMTRAAAIVCLTGSGSTARTVARFRPLTPLVALTTNEATRRRLALVWGLQTLPIEELGDDVEQVVTAIGQRLIRLGLAVAGDRVILTAGLPFNAQRATNTLRIATIADPEE